MMKDYTQNSCDFKALVNVYVYANATHTNHSTQKNNNGSESHMKAHNKDYHPEATIKQTLHNTAKHKEKNTKQLYKQCEFKSLSSMAQKNLQQCITE